MAYWDVAQIASDVDLGQRVTAAAAQEGRGDPPGWTAQHVWDYASQPGWGDAWASAVAGGNEAPGRDPAVITDGQILSAVQAIGS